MQTPPCWSTCKSAFQDRKVYVYHGRSNSRNPKMIHILIHGTYEYVRSHGKREIADVIKVTNFKIDCSGWSSGPSQITCSLKIRELSLAGGKRDLAEVKVGEIWSVRGTLPLLCWGECVQNEIECGQPLGANTSSQQGLGHWPCICQGLNSAKNLNELQRGFFPSWVSTWEYSPADTLIEAWQYPEQKIQRKLWDNECGSSC